MDSLQHICAFLCVEVFAMATAGENKQPRGKLCADPTISVSDLEKAFDAFMKNFFHATDRVLTNHIIDTVIVGASTVACFVFARGSDAGSKTSDMSWPLVIKNDAAFSSYF